MRLQCTRDEARNMSDRYCEVKKIRVFFLSRMHTHTQHGLHASTNPRRDSACLESRLAFDFLYKLPGELLFCKGSPGRLYVLPEHRTSAGSRITSHERTSIDSPIRRTGSNADLFCFRPQV